MKRHVWVDRCDKRAVARRGYAPNAVVDQKSILIGGVVGPREIDHCTPLGALTRRLLGGAGAELAELVTVNVAVSDTPQASRTLTVCSPRRGVDGDVERHRIR